ncbi:hypothetical protein [Microvirga sp. 2TAF3]|uniref:hypothetical protein n=1 Tax=Microvirga sp. 2TAF3 TaxID=3233014 RepID=UPI003F99EAF9
MLKPGKLNKKFFTVSGKAKDAGNYQVHDSKKGMLSCAAGRSGAGKAAPAFRFRRWGFPLATQVRFSVEWQRMDCWRF